MPRRRTLLAAGAAAAAAVGAVTFAAALAGPAAAGPRPLRAYHDEAYGLAVQVAGRQVVAPTPYVRSADGRPVHDAATSVDVGDPSPLAALALDPGRAHVGALEVDAAAGRAEARAADVRIGGATGLTAKLVDARCTNGHASARLVDVRLAGQDLTAGLPDVLTPGSSTGVTGLVSIAYAERSRNADGSVTVNALHLRVAPGLTPGLLGTLLGRLDAQDALAPGAGPIPLSRVRGLDAGQQRTLRSLLPGARSADRSAQRPTGSRVAGDLADLADVVVSSATCDAKGHSPEPSASTTVIPAPSGSPSTLPSHVPSTPPSSAPAPTPVHTHHPVTG